MHRLAIPTEPVEESMTYTAAPTLPPLERRFLIVEGEFDFAFERNIGVGWSLPNYRCTTIARANNLDTNYAQVVDQCNNQMKLIAWRPMAKRVSTGVQGEALSVRIARVILNNDGEVVITSIL